MGPKKMRSRLSKLLRNKDLTIPDDDVLRPKAWASTWDTLQNNRRADTGGSILESIMIATISCYFINKSPKLSLAHGAHYNNIIKQIMTRGCQRENWSVFQPTQPPPHTLHHTLSRIDFFIKNILVRKPN